MEPISLLGPIAGAARWLADKIARRQRIVLRGGTRASVILYVDPDNYVMNRRGVIWIYNGGPARVTVNAAGWDARDGSRVEAGLPRVRTLEPGDPEMQATGSPSELLRAHAEHGGLVRMYVELAGEETSRRRALPPDWIGKVRRLAEDDRHDHGR